MTKNKMLLPCALISHADPGGPRVAVPLCWQCRIPQLTYYDQSPASSGRKSSGGAPAEQPVIFFLDETSDKPPQDPQLAPLNSLPNLPPTGWAVQASAALLQTGSDRTPPERRRPREPLKQWQSGRAGYQQALPHRCMDQVCKSPKFSPKNPRWILGTRTPQ